MQGLHNAANALAAHALGTAIALPERQMATAIRQFKGLPHRVELVAEAKGVRFFDEGESEITYTYAKTGWSVLGQPGAVAYQIFDRQGATFVDGGIIGGPPQTRGTTRLYLSGAAAARVAALFPGGPLEAVVVAGGPGAASAVKVAYAAWNKGHAALLMAVRALAIAEGVDAALLAEWRLSQPDLPARSESAVQRNARKAWRFVGEMEEIAATFDAAGLPQGFHAAAAEIYRRLAPWKDAPTPPSVAEASGALTTRP